MRINFESESSNQIRIQQKKMLVLGHPDKLSLVFQRKARWCRWWPRRTASTCSATSTRAASSTRQVLVYSCQEAGFRQTCLIARYLFTFHCLNFHASDESVCPKPIANQLMVTREYFMIKSPIYVFQLYYSYSQRLLINFVHVNSIFVYSAPLYGQSFKQLYLDRTCFRSKMFAIN